MSIGDRWAHAGIEIGGGTLLALKGNGGDVVAELMRANAAVVFSSDDTIQAATGDMCCGDDKIVARRRRQPNRYGSGTWNQDRIPPASSTS